MPMIHFQQRFAEAVRTFQKCQTIRKIRKRPIREGDFLILASWTGKPYRSKVAVLHKTYCTLVESCAIGVGPCGDDIEIEGMTVGTLERAALARDDGFGCASEMIEWFRKVHGLPFHGVIIGWPHEVV
jgi:hypothetical protein